MDDDNNNGTFNSTNEGIGSGSTKAITDDGKIALTILIITIASVIVYFLYNRTIKKDNDFVLSINSFQPPQSRQDYIDAKNIVNLEDPDDKLNLKKLLMLRALKNIPVIFAFEKEKESLDRLYKKGMLTDDMHNQQQELNAYVQKELNEVKEEAEMLSEGWSQSIWGQAVNFHKMIQEQAQGNDKTDENSQQENGNQQEKTKVNNKVQQKSKASTSVPQKKDTNTSVPQKKDTTGMTKEEIAERAAKELLMEEERENKKKKNKKGNKK